MKPKYWVPGLRIPIDPDATLNYTFDWEYWFSEGVVIQSYEILPGDNSIVQSHGNSDTQISIVVSGVPEGSAVPLTFRITASGSPEIQNDWTVTFVGLHQ